MERTYFIAVQIAVYIVALPLLAGALRWKRHSRMQRLLFFYLCLLFPLQIVADQLAAHQINNMPLAHLYTALEFGVLLWIFRLGWPRPWRAAFFWGILGAYYAWTLLATLFLEPLHTFNAWGRSTEGFLFICISLAWFIAVMQELRIVRLYRSFMFWISAGTLLYFAGNLLIFIFGQSILAMDTATSYEVWTIHAVLNILLYFIYTISFLCPPDRKISALSSS